MKTPEKELSNEEIDNLSDAELKTLIIRMITELIELCHKMKEEMKATQNEIKQNAQGTKSEGKETDSNQWFGTKGRNKHPTGAEWRNKNSKKGGEPSEPLWQKHSNIHIIGVREGEKQQQEIENLFENIIQNFPSLAKEIDFQEVQEAQSLKEIGPKEEHTKAHHN